MQFQAIKILSQPDLNCDSCGNRFKSEKKKSVKSYIGEKCYNCGSVILTVEDFQKFKTMQRAIKINNFISLPYMIYLNLFHRKKLKEQYGEYSTKDGFKFNQ